MFADVSCPFAYAGLTRISAYRDELGPGAPMLVVRAWPLELVNGSPLTGSGIAPKVDALRQKVVPDLFTGFDPACFPTTTLPALAAEAATRRISPSKGMECALALRRALFEEGADIGDAAVVALISTKLGFPESSEQDHETVLRDHAAGASRGVRGSPHFFTAAGDFFCPTLEIHHDDDGYEIDFDAPGFERFVSAAFS